MMSRARSILLLLAIVPFVGCSSRVASPDRTASTLDPAADPAVAVRKMATPEATVLALGSAFEHLDGDRYALLFTDNYLFSYASADSAGNAFRARLTRVDELQFANHLFVTGIGSLPPAQHARVTFETPLTAGPDPRPGKTYPYHQQIRTVARVEVDAGASTYRFTTPLLFFVVRGDSAQIPPELAARGLGPDPHRWWIEQWDEDGVDPATSESWGLLKGKYLGH